MARPTAFHTTALTTYTQTYTTAAQTVPNATYAGTATAGDSDHAAVIVDITALAADVLALKKVINSIIDDMQAAGMVD